MISQIPIESYRTQQGTLITRYALWFCGQFIGVRSASAPDAEFRFTAFWPEGTGPTQEYGLGMESYE